jgi:hypothetical protein
VTDYGVGPDGITNRSGGWAWSSARNIYCAINEEIQYSGQPVFVSGYDGNNETDGQVTARVCMTAWFGGTMCASPSYITNNTETGWLIRRSLDAANRAMLRNLRRKEHARQTKVERCFAVGVSMELLHGGTLLGLS